MHRSKKWFAIAAACVGGLFALTSQAANKPAKPEDVAKVDAAMPDKAPAAPKKAHKVLIFGNANGFVHSSISLGEHAIAKLGEKTGAYTSVISDDPAVFDDLSGYDAVMLVSTTGHFLVPKADVGRAPDPKKATAEEKKAFEEKKKAAEEPLVGYKEKEKHRFANLISFVKDGHGLAGIHAASDAYYDFPEWGEAIGGYFNGHPFHKVVVKLDDAKSPITAGFEGKSYPIDDETYTFKMIPWSREKLHILTSLDVSAFPEDYKKKENRTDHDYGISWIHTYGKGRVFYCAHGHSEHVYSEKPMLQEYLAGMQYVLGDLEADATPSVTKSAAAH